MRLQKTIAALGVCTALILQPVAYACTGITLMAKDGSHIQARTEEWGSFDLESDVIVTPRGMEIQSKLEDDIAGMKWTTKYGVVGMNGSKLPFFVDGMNEKGLVASVLYHPGFAEYHSFDPARAENSLNPLDLSTWLLTSFAEIDEIRSELPKVRVVPVPLELLGNITPPIHLLVSDASGETIVIEYLKGELHIFDNPVGVMTNAPDFPWHLTNLRNYIGLQAESAEPIKVGDLEVAPLGAGSGLLGLPGDFSPTSRFVRAVALRNTVRPLADGEDAVREAFRILNNFDIPIGAVDAAGKDIFGNTQWATAADTKNMRYYYRTANNSRLRVIDVNSVDFTKDEVIIIPADPEKKEDYKEVMIP